MPGRGGARGSLRPNVTFLQHLSEISRLQCQKAHSSIAVSEKLYINFINRVGSHLYQSPPRNLPCGDLRARNASGLARNSLFSLNDHLDDHLWGGGIWDQLNAYCWARRLA